ncbi:unnamed protein product [Larinioides sclopetarius]|uniref:Acyltransferase 3 domain-containing protein n=1 Tax=Larinioides sclopetarius TaxID=280406 RepID=A0AAV2B2H4_9ARAC
MSMSWFLACLMQLNVISPLFMIPLKRWPRIGLILSLVTICISCFASFILTKRHDLFATVSDLRLQNNGIVEINERMWRTLDELHQKTYVRFTPYLIGILLGLYLHKRRLTQKNNLLTLSFGWIMSAILLYFSLFGLSNREDSAWEKSVHNGVKDLLFSCSFSWLIFVCVTGQGGPACYSFAAMDISFGVRCIFAV